MTNNFCDIINEAMSKPEDLLYNWLFHYNTYTNEWACFPRDQKSDYFNGISKDVVRDETIEKCAEKAAIKELERRGTI